MFNQAEIDYINGQRLARFSTVSAEGQPDVAAIGYKFDGRNFNIRGIENASTRKYRNIAAGQTKVALIIDDLGSVDPWRPRGVRIYGIAAIVDQKDKLGSLPIIRVTPNISWSWGLGSPDIRNGKFAPRRVEHEQE